jgi:acyl carrier protein
MSGFSTEKLKSVMAEALEIDSKQVTPALALGTTPKWDSLGHMNLMFSIEDAFGVRFESEEIPELKTFGAIESALRKRL